MERQISSLVRVEMTEGRTEALHSSVGLSLDGQIQWMCPVAAARYPGATRIEHISDGPIHQPEWRRYAINLYNSGRWERWIHKHKDGLSVVEIGPSKMVERGLLRLSFDLSRAMSLLSLLPAIMAMRPSTGLVHAMLMVAGIHHDIV